MNYSKQELSNLIFKNLKRAGFKENALWGEELYIRFVNSLSEQTKLSEFISVMRELCSDGFFTEAIHPATGLHAFRLTAKCVSLLRSL